MSYDFNAIEEKWKEVWEREKAFEPKIGGKKFLLTVPWPYCNGALHIGHGRTYTIGDVIARYKRMKGFNVLYPMGFHISGTPIVAFSRKIENGDEDTLQLYRSYLELYGDDPSKVSGFSVPDRIATYFATKIINDFTDMGFSIDWTRQFTSGEPIYNKFIEWQFSILLEKNLIKMGDYPILYSPREGNPVGEDDILEGDTDKVSINQFTAVYFYRESDILLASTLRPETLEGVTNIFVNPEAIYCRMRMGGKSFILSNQAFQKLKLQMEAELVSEFKGEELIGKDAEEPLHGRKIPVIGGRFVDPDIATGIDYSVPAHSIWDYVALVDSSRKLKMIKVIETDSQLSDMEAIRKKFGIESLADRKGLEEATKYLYEQEYYRGRIVVGRYKGQVVKDVKDRIVSDLISGSLAIPFYETSRKALTREGNSVSVAIIKNQWFIDYSLKWWKDDVRELLETMMLRPESLKNQFLQTVNWVRERPCARKRGLGTRLPTDREWVIESLSDSTIYTAVYTVIPLLRNMVFEEIDNSIFNFIFLGDGDISAKSEKTRMNAQEARREFLYWYPVDLRHTTYPHISNHLTFYLFNHVAIFPKDKWPVGISTGGMVISEGQKMSKSKGNVYPLLTVKRKYGADLFRLYLCSNADVWSDVDWRTSEVENYARKLERFLSLAEEANRSTREPEERDLWLLSRMMTRIKRASEFYEEMKIREASVDLFFDSLNDIRDLESFAGKERMLSVVKKFAREWSLSLAPIIPFLSEEVNSIYGGKKLSSMEEYPMPESSYTQHEKEWEFVESLIEDYRRITKVSSITPETMFINTAEKWKWDLLAEAEKTDIGKMLKDATPEKREFLIAVRKSKETVKRRRERQVQNSRNPHGTDGAELLENEEEVLNRYKEDLSRFLGVRIIVNGSTHKEKGKMAMPGRPSITLA